MHIRAKSVVTDDAGCRALIAKTIKTNQACCVCEYECVCEGEVETDEAMQDSAKGSWCSFLLIKH